MCICKSCHDPGFRCTNSDFQCTFSTFIRIDQTIIIIHCFSCFIISNMINTIRQNGSRTDLCSKIFFQPCCIIRNNLIRFCYIIGYTFHFANLIKDQTGILFCFFHPCLIRWSGCCTSIHTIIIIENRIHRVIFVSWISIPDPSIKHSCTDDQHKCCHTHRRRNSDMRRLFLL